jgi:hypothetical protein
LFNNFFFLLHFLKGKKNFFSKNRKNLTKIFKFFKYKKIDEKKLKRKRKKIKKKKKFFISEFIKTKFWFNHNFKDFLRFSATLRINS